MKKFAIFAILFLLPLASAIDLEMNAEFNQGETFLLKFSGNFQEVISEDNIIFYRDHVRIPMNFELMRVKSDYYIYASLKDKNPGNYSVALENAQYYKQGQIVNDTVSKNFTLAETFADFSIHPGFISTTEDFEVELQNLQDTEITININKEIIISNESEEETLLDKLTGNVILGEQDSITFSPNEIKKINFELEDIPEPILNTISFSTANTNYELPVYIPSPVAQEDYSINLNFEPSELKISFAPDLTKDEIITLTNIGDKILENVTFELSNNLESYINISKNYVYGVAVNASVEIFLRFDSTNLEETIQGELTARIPNETEDLVIIFEPLIEGETPEEISAASKNCKEINGTLFEESEECLDEVRFTNDGNCCLGEIKKPEKSNTGLIVGWVIIMIIIVAVIWFFKFKYKAGKEEIDVFKIAKKRGEK